MWLSLALIDFMASDGTLTSFEVRAKGNSSSVVVDRLRDILPDYLDHEKADVGGIRIYNATNCLIWKRNSRLRTYDMNENNCASFTFQHVGIPMEQGHRGIYNLVLAPEWRLRELKMRRASLNYPYDLGLDEKNRWDDKKRLKKRECPHTVIWDKRCKTQIVEMDMIPYENAFSFLVQGKVSLMTTDHDRICYVKAVESENAIRSFPDIDILDKEGKEILANELAEKSDWLELKPNIWGFGINLNKIIRDILDFFRRWTQRKTRQ